MNVQETLRYIKFKIGTFDDINNKAINPIVDNQHIIDELNSQLRQYATITKGIQDVYSSSIDINTSFIPAPPLALRSEAYMSISNLTTQQRYQMDIRSQQSAFTYFPVGQIAGISNWLMPWFQGTQKFFAIYPLSSVGYATTNLTSSISPTDTTIPVTLASSFYNSFGRMTIENEKILYTYQDDTNFYGCQRGVEQTTPLYHANGTEVRQNNLIIYYSRLPNKIVVADDNIIPQNVLEYDIEVVEEHMEGIIQAVAYHILIKLDPSRATIYREDFQQKYLQYQDEIKKGVSDIQMGSNIVSPNPQNQTGVPGFTLLY